MSSLRVVALPTVAEVLRELPLLLAATGELKPQQLRGPSGGPSSGPLYTYAVIDRLQPAWANPDFEPKLPRLSPLERAYVERQMERSHRLADGAAWRLKKLPGAVMTDWSIGDGEEPWGALMLEVPCLTSDRKRAVLRGQRTELYYAEDFEHWLVKVRGTWHRE